ncbi:hypothetical protein B379_05495 [Anoxybacillus ayderensis G10]|nr:hypothetical protein B379_05495 [Anoxybacillus ayderensis G10]
MFEGIVLDIDDTLIRENKLHLDDLQYIKKLKNRGYKVVLATGRDIKKTMEIAKKLEITEPLILLQGALIYYNSNEVFETAMNKNITKDIVQWCVDNGLTPRLITKNGSYLFNNKDLSDNLFISEAVLQIEIDFKDNITKKDSFENNFKDRSDMMIRAHRESVVCMSIEIDKGLALRRIANERGWDLTKFISIGNFPSDIHLFDETGFNIVIENNKNLKKIKNIKNIQIISNDNISTLLDRVLSKVEVYEGVRYRKNLDFRIRTFGDNYYVLGKNTVQKVSKLIFDLWRSINGEVNILDSIRNLTIHYNIFDLLEGLKYLITKKIIEEN